MVEEMALKRKHICFRTVCTCGEFLDGCEHAKTLTHMFSPCIHKQTPRQLFDEIVSTYARQYHPDPVWLSFALVRVGKAWKQNPDRVMQQVKAAVAEQNMAAALLIPGPAA